MSQLTEDVIGHNLIDLLKAQDCFNGNTLERSIDVVVLEASFDTVLNASTLTCPSPPVWKPFRVVGKFVVYCSLDRCVSYLNASYMIILINWLAIDAKG